MFNGFSVNFNCKIIELKSSIFNDYLKTYITNLNNKQESVLFDRT